MKAQIVDNVLLKRGKQVVKFWKHNGYGYGNGNGGIL